MVFIKAISYYLPDRILDNEQLNREFPDWDASRIAEKLGIRQRRIAASDEFASDMAVKAANKLFEEHKFDRNSVDFLILCTQSPDYFLPTTACILQERLSLPKSVGAFDFNLGCSGFVYGLAMAKGLIIGGMAKTVLLVTSETYSKFIHKEDRSNRTIFGDAAAATLISGIDGAFEIGEFVFGTDGRGAENLIVKKGGLRFRDREPTSSAVNDEFGNRVDENCLFMNGPEVFAFSSEVVPGLISETIRKNGLIEEDVAMYVLHQANKYMLSHLRKRLNFPESKLFIHLENCGNTVSSTIPIALAEMWKQNSLSKGSNVLIAGFGVGYSWGACNLRYI